MPARKSKHKQKTKRATKPQATIKPAASGASDTTGPEAVMQTRKATPARHKPQPSEPSISDNDTGAPAQHHATKYGHALWHWWRRLDSIKRLTLLAGLVAVLAVIAFGIWQYHHSRQQSVYNQQAVLFSQEQPAGPLLTAYRQRVDKALASSQPILTLGGLAKNAATAQDTAINSQRMQDAAHDNISGQALRSQVFQANKLPASEATGKQAACKQELDCYKIEIYFFATNATGSSVVGINSQGEGRVLNDSITPYSQPELPQDLTDITKELLTGSRELEQTVHEKVDVSKLVMVNGKTALKQTRCERSEHLCVAPTLAKEHDAYWVIVDLTDQRIVGVTWTSWRDKVAAAPSEQSVIDKAITQKYCGVDNQHSQNGWQFDYTLTGSDGIELKQVSYNGTPMLASVKNPDWHVSYSHQDGFGYSDAVGCPIFSTAAVVPAVAPQFKDLKDNDNKTVGFELVQEFKSKLWPQPCNYYYQQRYQFFNDGSFRPVSVSLGRGCGDDGTYRPVTRIQPATAFTTIDRWDDSGWQPLQRELWEHDALDAPLSTTDADQRYKLSSNDKTISFTLNRGQFQDGGRGDKAWIYVDRFHSDKDEGNGDMPTFGSCCNTDYHQGPEIYTNNEVLSGQPLLLWYVAEQKNNGTAGEQYCWAESTVSNGIYNTKTYPCPSGPKLKLSSR